MDEYARAAARVHAALGALQAAPEGSRGRYTDEFTQELYNARSVRKTHGLPRMPFIAQLTELIASCKPSGAYGLVPELFARALVDVHSVPSMPFAGDLGPNQWWRAIPSASAPPPPAPAPTYRAPPSMPVAGPSHQYQPVYAHHYARSLSPQPPPPPPSHGRKRTASAAQLDPRPEYSAGGRDKIKFEMWTGGQHAESSSGQPAGAGAGATGARTQAKYARYNPDEPGPPKGYELCTDEQSRCDRCRERGIECWKGRKRKRASGACWNCHKLKRPCSMAKDWFSAKPFAAMSEPYETDPGSVVVLQLNEAGRLLSPRAAALAEEQAYAQRQQQRGYASSSHAAYHDDRPSYNYGGRQDNPHNGARARSSTYAGSSPHGTAYSSPVPHSLPLPAVPDHHASRRASVSTPYAQHPRYYPPPPIEVPPPPPPDNVPLAIPPPPPPERIHYSTHVQAPIPLDVSGDTGPRPIPPPPPPNLPHYHGPRRSATPHGSSSYARSEASASASAPATGPSASTSSQARSSSSQSHSSHEYPYATGPPQGYYDRGHPAPERHREPAERYYDSEPPPRAGSGANYERETYAAVYPPPPGYAYPPPEAYHRPGQYPPPHPHPHPLAHGRYNPLVDARRDPYALPAHDAHRPASRPYPPPPLQPPPLADTRAYQHHPYGPSQSQYSDGRLHSVEDMPSRVPKRAESPVIPPPPPLEWPDHPPRAIYERRRASTRETGSRDRDTISRDRDTAAPEDRDEGARDGKEDRNGEVNGQSGRGDTSIDERGRALLASMRDETNRDVEMKTSSPTPVLATAASPEIVSHNVEERARMLLASTREQTNGTTTTVITSASTAPVPVVQRQDERDMDRDVRSPRPSRTPISTPPPPPPSTAPPGSTGTHTPGSAAAAERPACARPPNSSASTASADVNSSPPRAGTAKRPWLI
ncbi:unnamed protein product [Peniophora sp. CBMAI 1063]|nr:unnamed protein product [Peniophora sp. CBMAI 1063]